MRSLKQSQYIFLGIFLLIIAGITACQQDKPDGIAETPAPESAAAEPASTVVDELMTALNMHQFKNPVQAPDFELSSLEGNKISLSQYRGKVVFLSFWATW